MDNEEQLTSFPAELPTTDQAAPEDQLADALARIAQLEQMFGELQSRISNKLPQPPVFIGEQTNSDGRWREMIITSNTIDPMGTVGFGGGRGCDDATGSAYALPFALLEAQFLVVEMGDDINSSYLFIPNGIFKVYLTQNGGSNGTPSSNCSYTYDCYLDLAKTIKVGSTLVPEWRYLKKCPVTAATKGQGYFNGSTFVLEIAYEELGSNSCA